MKRVMPCLIILALSLVVMGANPVYSQDDDAMWVTFSKNLAANLASENSGVKQSAMKLIIIYGDKLKLDDEAIFELIEIYNREKDVKYRQMALVTLYSLKNKWAMEFIKQSYEFEKNSVLKHTIAAMVLEYQSSNNL
ncbi:hypothetical protein IIC38_18955 [candidate division KSB1 bacterium]|nr:hypothetical protein [candidate division KSB1 bacterium]